MTKQEIIDKALPVLKSNSLVLSCSLFGSYAKDKATQGSDVDFLLCLKKGASLLDRADIQMALQDKIGTHVDVVSPAMLHPYIKDKVLKEKIDFYGN